MSHLMQNNKLLEFLRDKEWYDNSRLEQIVTCNRKGYYMNILAGGLKMGVGTGADFGSCLHAGVAAYYMLWGRADQLSRRRNAFRVFSEVYGRMFPSNVQEALQSRHELSQGLLILDNYFDSHLSTDFTLRPVEVELGGTVKIEPREGEQSFKPFWYVFRMDGLHERVNYGDYFVRELKSTSGGAERRLKALKIDRQSLGYLYCARQFPGPEIAGVLGDVVLVAARTLDARRDYFIKTKQATEDWRVQTINIVEHWRSLAERAHDKPFNEILNTYTQNTNACLNYGMCHYYDLCDFGVSPSTLTPFERNDWNPLADYDFGITDSAIEVVTPTAIKETHVVKENL